MSYSFFIFFLFFVELVFLFFLSKSLTSSLASLFYKFTKSKGATVNLLAILFLPGTIIHELSHLLMASLLLVPVGDIEVFPQIEGDEVKLGSVKVGQTDILRRSLIGVAPILVGLTILFCVLALTQNTFWDSSLIIKGALFYLVFQITNNMFSSSKDMEGVILFFGSLVFLLTLLIVVSYLLGFTQQLQVLGWILNPQIVNLFLKADTYLVLPILIDLAVISVYKIFT